MIPGSTPRNEFVLPLDEEMVKGFKEIEITYVQNEKEILKKYKKDCEIDGSTVTVRLSQEDTFLFKNKVMVEIQIRCLDSNGEIHTSDIMRATCERCLSNEVLK